MPALPAVSTLEPVPFELPRVRPPSIQEISARTWIRHFLEWMQFDEPRVIMFYIDFFEDEIEEVFEDPRLIVLQKESNREAEHGEDRRAKLLWEQREQLKNELATRIDTKLDELNHYLRKIDSIALRYNELTDMLVPLVVHMLRKHRVERVSDLPQSQLEEMMEKAKRLFYES